MAGLLERGKEEEKRTTFGGRRLGHTRARARASKARTPTTTSAGEQQTHPFLYLSHSASSSRSYITSALKRFLGGGLVSERDINKLIRLDVDQAESLL